MIPYRTRSLKSAKNDTLIVSGASTLAIALLAGTGGIADTHYLNNRQERGYKLPFIEKLSSNSISSLNVSAINLKRIRQIIKPSISELASLFGVSRQAIYNWLSGEEPTIENATRIVELAKTADFLAAEGLTSSQLLKRKFMRGHSLYDIIKEGGSSYEAAQKLAQILQTEAKQRKLLDERLAGRKTKPQDYSDYGSSMLDD